MAKWEMSDKYCAIFLLKVKGIIAVKGKPAHLPRPLLNDIFKYIHY
jgi:hypothetical protein